MTTQHKIKHLFWRFGFGMSMAEWTRFQSASLEEAIQYLFFEQTSTEVALLEREELAASTSRPMDQAQRKERLELERASLQKQNMAWVQRMADPKTDALLERMTLFWHGHFACRSRTATVGVGQLNTLRQQALGNFRDLVLAIARDPAMIRYLNNQQNRKDSPNENFARELLELFTIGRGNYTEQDIKEGARAFTGWSSNLQGEYRFRAFVHDYEEKTFMGKTGKFDGDDIIDIILAQPVTALFLTRKIYRYFVQQEVDEKRVQQLADDFYRSDYDIKALLLQIAQSDWFYGPSIVGTKIKSPVELLAGVMRTLNLAFSTPAPIMRVQKGLGQVLFNPPNVAGWAGGKAWIDNSTLLYRLNLVQHFVALANKKVKQHDDEQVEQMMEEVKAQNYSKWGKLSMNLDPFTAALSTKSEQEIFNFLKAYLLQIEPSIQQAELADFVVHSSPENYIKTTVIRLMSLPEYQLC